MRSRQEQKEYKWLERARRGDEKSFAKIYDEYVDQVYRFVYLKVGSEEKAQEIVQDVFLKFWNNIKFDESKERKAVNIKSFLYRIARTSVIDYYRSKEAQVDKSVVTDEEYLMDMKDGKVDLAQELNIEAEYKLVISAMKELPENYQSVLNMKFVEELTNVEIGEMIGKKEGTVRVMVSRGIKMLKVKLKNDN